MVKLKLYRLTLREAFQQGWLTFFFGICRRLMRMGYGHCALVVEEVEYSLTIDGLVSYDSKEGDEWTHDYLLLDIDELVVLAQILKFEEIVGNIRVSTKSLLRSLSRPNCYHEHACCTHFVSYVLTIPPCTLVDELCLKILSSDTSHVQIAEVKTTSESGELQKVEKNATALVANRQSELSLIRRLLGLYEVTDMLRLTGANLLRKLASSMTF